jgi:hypothetical protein
MTKHSKISAGCVYQILIQGRLDTEWSAWLSGMSVILVQEDPPITKITGIVIDQAQLRGIINKIWDLNLTLISVKRVE